MSDKLGLTAFHDQLSEARRLLQELQSDKVGFEKLASFLKDHTGINLVPNEKNFCLMAGRVAPLLQQNHFSSYEEYYQTLRGQTPEVVTEFISALTTNTTEFFRENKHFELFKEYLEQLVAKKQKENNREIRIWCAAASTGQEPYSILMTVLETIPNITSWDVKFLASDIDNDVLMRAQEGIYSQNEMQNIPPMIRQKYFTSKPGSRDMHWIINKSLRDMIRFATFNLMSDPYPFQHKFDFIWCRNVLIYFERETSSAVIERMGKSLQLGGTLFLGHSEAGLSKTPLLKSLANASYRRGD